MKKKRFTIKASSGSETYYVALDSAGRVASSGSTENPKSLSQLRSAGRKVKTFKSYEEYSKFLDQCYDSMKEQSSMSKREVGASRSAKRRFTVTASSKRRDIRAGYTPKGRKALWLFNADENQWVLWGTWPRDTVTEDEMYSLSHRRFPNSEYDADYNYTDYMLLPNDGSEPDDGRPVRASTAPKRKFTVTASKKAVKASAKSDTIVVFYDDNFVSSGGWDAVRGGIHDIVSRDDAALRACIDYCNSFGDPLIGEDFASPRDVADTMTEVVAAEYNESWDTGVFFILIPVSGTRGIEIFDKADMAVNASYTPVANDMAYKREDYSGEYVIVHNGNVIITTDGSSIAGRAGGYEEIYDIIKNDPEAVSEIVEYLNQFDNYFDELIGEDKKDDPSEVADALATFIQREYDEGQSDPGYFGSYVTWNGNVLEWFDAADLADDVTSAKSVKCGYDLGADTADDTYTVDSFFGYNGDPFRGLADGITTDDWSEVESWSHEHLMKGENVKIDGPQGVLEITADEYNQAWEDGAADFDINEEIVDYKRRIVESSTAIKCSDKEDIKCAYRDDTVDKEAVRELVLVITNDGDLYRQRTTPMIENLKKKVAKGKYDRELAVKLWQYLADEGVRRYDKEYGSGRGSVSMLNPATRRAIAEELRDYYEEQIMWDVEHANDGKDELTTL